LHAVPVRWSRRATGAASSTAAATAHRVAGRRLAGRSFGKDSMANWRTELHRLARRDPLVGHETAVLVDALYETESDRGAALIAGSIAENALDQILIVRFVPMSPPQRDALFEYNAPLGTFSAKIKLAYAFGFIDKIIRDDFDRIREIRNVFAHSMIAVKFVDEVIRRTCTGFSKILPDAVLTSSGDNPKYIYIHTCVTLLAVANVAMARFNRRHVRLLQKTLCYDDAIPSRNKYFARLLAQTQTSPRLGNT